MTGAERKELEHDAQAVGWTPEDVVLFRHCFALLGEETGLEIIGLAGRRLRVFYAFPLSVRESDRSFLRTYKGMEVPRALARFFDWWRAVCALHPVCEEEFDWPAAMFIYVTNAEKRRGWTALVELAGNLDPLLAHLPRKQR